MTKSVMRVLLAMFLVAFSVMSARTDELDDESNLTAGQRVQKATQTLRRADCERKSKRTTEEKCRLWGFAYGSGGDKSPNPSIEAQSSATTSPQVIAEPAVAVAQFTSAPTPASFTGQDLQGTFPTSRYPAKPGNTWKSINEWPNKATWDVACAALVEKTKGNVNALPEEVCIRFRPNSRGLEPVNGDIHCWNGNIPNGVVIDGQVYGKGGKVIVWSNITVTLPESANRRTKVCRVGTFEGRDLYVIQPEGCTNYSYIWVTKEEQQATPVDPCLYRKVMVLVYDHRKLDSSLAGVVQSMTACGKVGCKGERKLFDALNMSMESGSTLLATDFDLEVFLVDERTGDERKLSTTLEQGALTFLVPLAESHKVIYVLAKKGSYAFPLHGTRSRIAEWRCDKWQKPSSCQRPLYLSFVTK